MQVVAINAPKSEIRNRLLNYLISRQYKIIKDNYSADEIVATRRISLFKRYRFHVKIIYLNENAAHFVLKVNPQNQNPTPYDLNKELLIAESIYFNF